MTHILHRSANAELPVAVGGKGIELFDQRGASYIDASGGAAVSCVRICPAFRSPPKT